MSISPSPDLAIAFATIERPSAVQRLIRSARARFPSAPIYVADQSRHIEPMKEFYDAHGVHVVRMPFDSGVAESRNRLVELIEQEYFVLCDDDFIFLPETSFEDALTIMNAAPDVGVIGGRLVDTSEPSPYTRHWEMYLEYDPARRLLLSVPIYNFAPVMRTVNDVRFYMCDSVMNFALFRRSLFTDGVCWDKRFTCNGEHEDFFLNLKLRGGSRVAYLPSMVAEHNHPYNYSNYQHRLRDRSEGWLLFMDKWEIDQVLELGLGVRTRDDPGGVLTASAARTSYGLPAEDHTEHLSVRLPATPAIEEGALTRFRIFFRYDPLLRPENDFILWYRAERSSEDPGDGEQIAPVFLRWFGPEGETLLWESEEFALELGPAHWQPMPVSLPLLPRNASWARFEVMARTASGAAPLATGFIFPEQQLTSRNGAESAAQASDVLALSRMRNPANEWPGGVPIPEAVSSQPARSLAEEASPESGGDGLVLVPLEQAGGAPALLFQNWDRLFGAKLVGVWAPGPELHAPTTMALPGGDWAAGAAVMALGHDGALSFVRPFVPERGKTNSKAGVRSRGPSVTAVLTSCGRLDLLDRTLTSFFALNTCPVDRFIVVEDGPRDANLALMQKFRDRSITWIGTERRAGQIEAIDLAYSLVETDWIFHLEDDWEFYEPGFIEKSYRVLEADPACLQVWLRAHDDTNGHPLLEEVELVGGVEVRKLAFDYLDQWHGFSFNPGLRRTADYRHIGGYGRHVRFDPNDRGCSELGLSRLYRDLGMYAAILADNDGKGYVRHIGWGRTTPPP